MRQKIPNNIVTGFLEINHQRLIGLECLSYFFCIEGFFLLDNYFSPGKVCFADQFFSVIIFKLQFISEYKLLDHSNLAIQQSEQIEIQNDRKEINNMATG